MAVAKGKVAQERVDAGIVDANHEQLPSDEVMASGEGFDHEASDEIAEAALRSGAPGEPVILPAPSGYMNPYVSEEEQGMEMVPAVVGPPAYGSPVAATSAGRLVPLSTHPLRAEVLPDDHPAAISGDYGEGYGDSISGTATVQSQPGHPGAGATGNEDADATEAAIQLANENEVDLSQVEGTGADGRITKGDVEDFIAEREDAGNSE